jgi:hypothetical protein
MMRIMKHESRNAMARMWRTVGLVAVALLVATAVSGQSTGENKWRIGASTGGFVPFSSLVSASDDFDTELESGPAFSLDLQYQAQNSLAIYANGTGAFGSIRLGSSIQPAVLGPSSQVVLGAATGGVLFAPTGWLGEHVQPTLRLGGGFKTYMFDLTGADNQTSLTGDVGVGLRGIGFGPIELTAEIRYLPSSFDQSKLPIRGIEAQDQRQSDVIFGVGFAIRPGGTPVKAAQ